MFPNFLIFRKNVLAWHHDSLFFWIFGRSTPRVGGRIVGAAFLSGNVAVTALDELSVLRLRFAHHQTVIRSYPYFEAEGVCLVWLGSTATAVLAQSDRPQHRHRITCSIQGDHKSRLVLILCSESDVNEELRSVLSRSGKTEVISHRCRPTCVCLLTLFRTTVDFVSAGDVSLWSTGASLVSAVFGSLSKHFPASPSGHIRTWWLWPILIPSDVSNLVWCRFHSHRFYRPICVDV